MSTQTSSYVCGVRAAITTVAFAFVIACDHSGRAPHPADDPQGMANIQRSEPPTVVPMEPTGDGRHGPSYRAGVVTGEVGVEVGGELGAGVARTSRTATPLSMPYGGTYERDPSGSAYGHPHPWKANALEPAGSVTPSSIPGFEADGGSEL